VGAWQRQPALRRQRHELGEIVVRAREVPTMLISRKIISCVVVLNAPPCPITK
jgi:hypothetical protein